MKVNRVLHCQTGNSNKVYLCCISEEDGKYIVVGKWGRLHSKLDQQTKGTYSTDSEADRAREAFCRRRLQRDMSIDIERARCE